MQQIRSSEASKLCCSTSMAIDRIGKKRTGIDHNQRRHDHHHHRGHHHCNITIREASSNTQTGAHNQQLQNTLQ